MQNSRDSSIWRSLAVAFGNGVALGVGMKLTQTASRQIERPSAPAVGSFDQDVLEAVVNALEARLNEHAAKVDRRLADLESRIAMDRRTLQERVEREAATTREHADAVNREFAQAAGARMEKDLGAVRQEMISINREFARSVSRIVAEQATAAAADVESRIREEVVAANLEIAQSIPGIASEQASFQMEACATALQQSLDLRIDSATEERITPLREELNRKEHELQDLRQKVGAIDSNMLDFILAMGQMCRQVSERVAPPAPQPDMKPQAPVSLEADGKHGAEIPVPEFTQPKNPGGLWRVPLVSSVVLTLGGLVAMHYL